MIASRGLWVFRKLGKKGTKIKARNTSAIKADETVEINGRTMRVSSGRRDSKGIILFSGRVPLKFEVDTCCQWVQCPSSGWSLGTCRPATYPTGLPACLMPSVDSKKAPRSSNAKYYGKKESMDQVNIYSRLYRSSYVSNEWNIHKQNGDVFHLTAWT